MHSICVDHKKFKKGQNVRIYLIKYKNQYIS